MLYKNSKTLRILFLKIWCFHVFFYYLILGFLIADRVVLINRKLLDMLSALVALPFGGIIGITDSFPLFFIFPILVMLFFLRYTNFSFYKIYVIAIVSTHLIRFGVQYMIYPQEGMVFGDNDGRIMLFLYTIASLLLISLLNYIVFKKSYKKLTFK